MSCGRLGHLPGDRGGAQITYRRAMDEHFAATVNRRQTTGGYSAPTSRDADQTVIGDTEYLSHFGVNKSQMSAHDLWRHLVSQVPSLSANQALSSILRQGPLSRRIERALQRRY